MTEAREKMLLSKQSVRENIFTWRHSVIDVTVTSPFDSLLWLANRIPIIIYASILHQLERWYHNLYILYQYKSIAVITAGFFVSISWPPAAIALHIFTTCSTQEYVGQSHDQIKAFSLGQTSPRQNNLQYHSNSAIFFTKNDRMEWRHVRRWFRYI